MHRKEVQMLGGKRKTNVHYLIYVSQNIQEMLDAGMHREFIEP